MRSFPDTDMDPVFFCFVLFFCFFVFLFFCFFVLNVSIIVLFRKVSSRSRLFEDRITLSTG